MARDENGTRRRKGMDELTNLLTNHLFSFTLEIETKQVRTQHRMLPLYLVCVNKRFSVFKQIVEFQSFYSNKFHSHITPPPHTLSLSMTERIE